MADGPTDAYAEGYDAYLAGKSDLENPYDTTSNECLSWNDGWIAAEEAAADAAD